MLVQYREESEPREVHSHAPKVYVYDGEPSEEICECESVTVVQALYDWAGSYRVRIDPNKVRTFNNEPIYLTPNQARQLASFLTFAANDAETLERTYGDPEAGK